MSDYGQQQPYGQQPYGQQQPYQPAYGQQPYPQADPDRRPGTVVTAVVLAIVGAGLTLVAVGFFGLAAAVASDDFVQGLEEGYGSDIGSQDTVVGVIVAVCAVLAIWSLAAIVIAVFALRRSNVARILLVVSSGLAALVSLLAAPLGLLMTAMAIATVVLLFVGGANEWYSRRGGAPVQPGYYAG